MPIEHPDTPRYRDLPDGDARGVFGEDDVIGSLNRLTDTRVLHAASLVRTGERFSLSAPLTWPDPPLYGRARLEHTILRTALGNRDDVLNSFHPQGSSQWDAFTHIRDPELGWYNRRETDQLGIETWSRWGIVGRAVLVDAAHHCAAWGRPLGWRSRDTVSVDDLRAMLDADGIEPRAGDVLLLRTGWTEGYQGCEDAERLAVKADPTSPGLEPSRQMLEFLWDWGVSAVASDNISVEALPPEGFVLHPHLLNRLGIPIGELWWLDALAAACRADGRFESMLVSVPLDLPGGVGSPCNAIAIR